MNHRSNAHKPINGTDKASIVPVGELVKQHAQLRPPVVEGLLRRGETANIIAAAKVGKSWLAYSLALSVVTGSDCPRTSYRHQFRTAQTTVANARSEEAIDREHDQGERTKRARVSRTRKTIRIG